MKITFAQADALAQVAVDATNHKWRDRLELLRGDHGKIMVVSGKRASARPLNELGAWVWLVAADGKWKRVSPLNDEGPAEAGPFADGRVRRSRPEG